jgi:hypothetical protein
MITCDRIVFVDSEFDARKGRGERPGFPVCICAIEVFADGREIEHRLAAPYPPRPPWDRGDPYLTVGFALGAETGSMVLNVGWPMPSPAIDLYAEFMVLHNSEMCRDGEGKRPGPSLIQACHHYGVAGMDATIKDEMRSLAYTKTDHTPEEIAILQDYCLSDDCRMTQRLFHAMRPHIDFLRSPIRGVFAMQMERSRWRGLPIDVTLYRRAKRCAPIIRTKMRSELNRMLGFDVYHAGVFKRGAMFRLMQQRGIPIPIDPKTGAYSCSTRLLKPMIATYPEIAIFYEYKRMIDAFNRFDLEIGGDGRHRFWLNPYGTKTGRNNPSTTTLWGLPHTMRSFLKPPPGMAIAQVDFGNQEFGIAAALSGDSTAIADYLTGDPYRQFAVAALDIADPTAQQRQVYKACVLGRIYGMGADTLARNLGISRTQAQTILDQMFARYPVLNAWLERIQLKAAHILPITCTLGWSLTASGKTNEARTFLNFPMQANGAELMRLVFARAGDLPIIGCAHDSFLLEDRSDRIEQTVRDMQEVMRAASRDLLGGFELRADCDFEHDIVRHPDRFVDKREREDGMQHWNWLMRLIEEAEDDDRRREAGRSGDRGRDVGNVDEGMAESTVSEGRTEEKTQQAETGF